MLPTAETAAKLQPNVIAGFSEEHQKAAAAIERGYRLIVGPASVKPATFERGLGERRGELTAAQSATVERYQLWAEEMKRRRLAILPIIDMVVDGQQPWYVDRHHSWQPGTAASRLIEALDIFFRLTERRRASSYAA